MKIKNKKTNAEYMLDYTPNVKKVMEQYMKKVEPKEKSSVKNAIKETLRALGQEKIASKKSAYSSALTVRKAYKVHYEALRSKTRSGDSKAALEYMHSITANSWALRALGYTVDDYNPAFQNARIKRPPLVRFENMTPAPKMDWIIDRNKNDEIIT